MMRITNSMMMNTTKLNINSNKVSVDRLNTQMSTQKKITKPSDNPLIAIKSLRLSTTLSQINQYANNNIKDAQSWMDVTETALTNMKDILNDAYRLCVNGSTDVMTDDDRNTVLTQLKGLSGQLYSEANADYADRTVFSGYKTNSTVAFTDAYEASQAKYEIAEQLSASDIETYTYYANKLDTPIATEIEQQTAVATPEEQIFKRLRLSYNKLSDLNSFSYNYAVDTSSENVHGTTKGNVTITADLETNPAKQLFQWRSLQKDGAFTYQANDLGVMTGASMEDMNGYKLNISPDGGFSVDDPSLEMAVRITTVNGVQTTTYTFTDTSGNMVFTAQEALKGNQKSAYVVDSQGNRVELEYKAGAQPVLSMVKDMQGNTINTNLDTNVGGIYVKNSDNPQKRVMRAQVTTDGFAVTTDDKGLTTELKVEAMTQKEFEDYLTALAADPDTLTEQYKDTLIYLPDSGEMVIGSQLAENLSSEYATLGVNYDKNGFLKGETRPEMYFNCTNKTDASPANHITYTNYDEDNNWIAQNINYAVSANQDMTINTQIHDVISADCYRDLAELTDIVQASIDAHTTVANIESMIKSSDYPKEEEQIYLNDCLEKAKKQMAYADDHLQKMFGSQISNFEKYLNQVNLRITDVGTRGDQLSLAENRISNQKTTFTELKSSNEDEELSDVTIDYTSAYSAYQASLQAAGKIDDMSLLDYL